MMKVCDLLANTAATGDLQTAREGVNREAAIDSTL